MGAEVTRCMKRGRDNRKAGQANGVPREPRPRRLSWRGRIRPAWPRTALIPNIDEAKSYGLFSEAGAVRPYPAGNEGPQTSTIRSLPDGALFRDNDSEPRSPSRKRPPA